MNSLKIGVIGCAGQMGIALIRKISQNQNCCISGGVERIGHPKIGHDIGKVAGLDDLSIAIESEKETLFQSSNVIIDFTTPDSTKENVSFALKNQTKLIIGTTGLNKKIEKFISDAAKEVPILYSANMSIGINLLTKVVEDLSSKLPSKDFDIEVLEMHHKFKVDSPSGTAIFLGKSAAKGRSINLEKSSEIGRNGNQLLRKNGNIGFASLRGGGVAGDHTVIFASENERIEVTHKAHDRNLFAAGAVEASIWIADKKPGLYSMMDVLGIN
ncbi:4-hydroxy-tetrahydrodipicolinate reductase [Alphaproteobacteria bacterium]|nr:4-hydroxy-tetrahydrodipicolinate reductase [Alphaproteobacteria bacterium]